MRSSCDEPAENKMIGSFQLVNSFGTNNICIFKKGITLDFTGMTMKLMKKKYM